MSRLSYRRVRRNWSLVVAAWMEILWCCHCSYTNISTDRCLFCGARPPRTIRDVLASVPLPPRRDFAEGFPLDG